MCQCQRVTLINVLLRHRYQLSVNTSIASVSSIHTQRGSCQCMPGHPCRVRVPCNPSITRRMGYPRISVHRCGGRERCLSRAFIVPLRRLGCNQPVMAGSRLPIETSIFSSGAPSGIASSDDRMEDHPGTHSRPWWTVCQGIISPTPCILGAVRSDWILFPSYPGVLL
jgi:hypothetical protein